MNREREQSYEIDLGAMSSEAFRVYLLSHQVSAYNIANGVPILPEHEGAVRLGLWKLTGEPYTAFIRCRSLLPTTGRNAGIGG